MTENGLQKILKPVGEILARGNTAVVKMAKGGVLVLEERRTAVLREVGKQ